jgi:hypothetical protein
MQSGIIALSKDSGENWQTAITPDGIVAERLMGQIIAGQNLLITNQAGSFIIDNNGVEVAMDSFRVITTNGGNAINDWNQNVTDVGTLQSEFNVAAGKIALVVSETNEIKATEIASAITTTPDAISLISSEVSMSGDDIVSQIIVSPNAVNVLSENINLTGKVTFSALSTALQTEMNVYNGWRHSSDTTMINGGDIYTRSISADKIMTEQLVVGTNIAMGPNATIDWDQVYGAPDIPTSASDIDAVSIYDGRLTKITSTGVYTGTVEADNISAGTISGVTFDATNAGMTAVGTSSSSVKMWAGANYSNRGYAPFRVYYDGRVIASNIDIQGGNINISGDAKLGYELTVGSSSSGYRSRIDMSGAVWYSDGWNAWLSAAQDLVVRSESNKLHLQGGSARLEMFTSPSGEASLQGKNGSQSILKWTSSGFQIRNSSDGDFASISASSFVVDSRREAKENIESFEPTAIEKIARTGVYRYDRKAKESEKQGKNLGLILEEVPEEILNENGIDLYAMNAFLWKAIQELSTQVDYLRATVKRR